jgi:hypothetical protein
VPTRVLSEALVKQIIDKRADGIPFPREPRTSENPSSVCIKYTKKIKKYIEEDCFGKLQKT